MRNVFRIFSILIFWTAGRCPATGMIDFDNKNVLELDLHATTSENVTVPTACFENSDLTIRREILGNNNEWTKFKPSKEWLDGDGVIKGEYTVFPGRGTRWSLYCAKGN